MDRSVERDFFAGAVGPSDLPVSFDLEEDPPPFDLESREQRRAHFTRLVSGVMAALGVIAVLAVTRSAANVSETTPVVVAQAPSAEAAAVPPLAPANSAEVVAVELPVEVMASEEPSAEKASIAPPESVSSQSARAASASVEPAASVAPAASAVSSVHGVVPAPPAVLKAPPAPAPKAAALSRKLVVTRALPVAAPRVFVPKPPVARPVAPIDHDRPPPTARFAD